MELICENITKVYSGREVLQDVSLTLESGKIYGLIGRSKGVTVFLKEGQRVDESYDVSVQPVNLQKAFVVLCGEEG